MVLSLFGAENSENSSPDSGGMSEDVPDVRSVKTNGMRNPGLVVEDCIWEEVMAECALWGGVTAVRRRRRGIFPSVEAQLLLVVFLLMSLPASALTIPAGTVKKLSLASELSYVDDPESELDLGKIVHARERGDFIPIADSGEPNFGYIKGTVWLHAGLDNRSESESWILELPFATLDNVELYLLHRPTGDVLDHYRTGDKLPFSSRPLPHRYFVFPLALTRGGTYDLYLRVKSQGSVTVPLTLWNPAHFQLDSRSSYMGMTFYLGILAALFAYNLLLYLPLRDRVYFYYAAFVASMALGMGAWHGFLFEYLWPELPRWGNLAPLVGFDLTGMFGAVFSRRFLNSGEYAPRMDRLLQYCAWCFGTLAVAALVFSYQAVAILTSVTGVVFPVIAMASGIVCLRNGQHSARYFLLAWTVLLAGTATLGGRNLGIVETNFYSRYAMQFGSALEALLLSFALAQRITDLRRRKEAAETLALQDPLTGLANRVMLERRVEQALEEAKRYGRTMALLAVDLDGFKTVNDEHGHDVGDMLLRRIAERLRGLVGGQDTVARVGGDEFVIVLPGVSGPEGVAQRLAGAVVTQARRPVRVHELELRVSASVGLAVFPYDGEEAATLMKSADKAMYEAKRTGRNRCFSFASRGDLVVSGSQ